MEVKQTDSGIPVSKKPLLNIDIARIILIIALAVTGLLTYNTKRAVEREAKKEFSFECNEIASRIQSRLQANEQVLWNGSAFFEASDSVSRKEWEIFIRHQKIEQNLPGIEGVGYAVLISGSILNNHEMQIRNEGFPAYSLKPAGERALYTSIVYLEPFSERNQRAFGYDMYSEPTRREAMQRACDSNMAAMTGKVQLKQETGADIQAGTLMYVPIYHPGMPTSTLIERRKAIKGWVYSPYRMNTLMNGILIGQVNKINQNIRLQIYENQTITPETLLYDTENNPASFSDQEHKLSLTMSVVYNGKHWSLCFSKPTDIASFYFNKNVLLLFTGGTGISILLFLLAMFLKSSRYQLKVTSQLANELKESLDKQVALYNAIPDAIFISDSKTGHIEETNNKASEQYGYTHQEFTNLYSSAISLFPDQSDYPGYKGHLFFHDQFHLTKDGTVIPVEISATTFEIENSLKVIAVARDITDRVKSETDLNMKNEVFENSIAAQSIADSNGVFTHVNQAFLNMWGFENQGQVLGGSVNSLFAIPDEAKTVFESLLTVDKWQGEFNARKKDGSIFISKGYATSIRNNQGEIIGFQSTNLDVTQEKADEMKLIEFKIAIDQAGDGIAIINLNRKISFVNQTWAKMHGYTIEELAGCDISQFHTPDQFHNEVEPHLTNLLTNGTYSGEVGHKQKNGKTFPTWMSTTLLKDNTGNTIGYLGVAQDITLRKASELELQKSKERYQTLVENANDAIVVSLPGRIAFTNQRLLGMLGFTEQEVISANYADFMHPDDKEELLTNYAQLLEGKPLQKIPSRIIAKDGHIRWAEFSGIVIEWDGQPAVLSFISDITERRKAEQALRDSEALYKTTINASPDDITLVNLKGEIILVSPAALILFGYENTSEIIGRHILEFISSEEQERAIADIDLIMQGNLKGPEVYKCLRKNGTIIEAEINGELTRSAEGQPTGFVLILRDITERKLAENSLRESEEKWRSLVSNSPDFIALYDKEGNFLFLNRFAEGFSEKDILGRTVYEFLSPESRELFISKQNECISTWKPVRFEYIAQGDKGEMRVYEESIVPILTKNSEINLLAVARDITEQKKSELKLLESEEHFRLIFEEGSIAMALVNAEFKFTQVNNSFSNFIGYSAEELSEMTFVEITDPAHVEQDKASLLSLLNREISVYRTEKSYITRNNNIAWGLVQVSIMYDKAGEFRSFLVMIDNITDRKEAEKSLLQSEEIFNQFMLNSPIYVFFKDDQIRSLRLSRNFEQMLGRPLEELIGKNMFDMFPSDFAQKIVDDDLVILREGKQIELEEELNGRFYSTTKFPILIEGKPVYLAGYTIDITERKLADDLIKATLKEKEILLREVHHRVKNNLQVVSSLLNLQANKIADATLKDTLGQSRNRIRSIALVHEKLYQSGSFAEINFKEYTKSLVAELFRVYLADPGKIHVNTQIEDINIPLIYAIPCGLIMNEIISNSLKYAFPDNAKPGLKPEIYISLKTQPDNHLQLRAGDNGIGLPANYQISDSSSLGLYLISILSTEQLDGEIDIDTKKGTIFTITFNPFKK